MPTANSLTTTQSPTNILLVDDNPEALMAMESALHNLGVRIVTAGSADQALRLLLQEEFALILLDVNMPGTGGFALAGMIRQRLELKDVPIIFISATAQTSEDVLRGYAAGAADFIFLPCPSEFIQAKVGAFLDLVKMSRVMSRKVRKNEQLNHDLLVSRHLEERIIESEAAQTALSKSEQALHLALDELEIRVQERTADLRRVNLALQTMLASNQAVLHIKDEQQLMAEICRVMVEIGGYCLAWVGMAEEDKHVRPVAYWGADVAYLDGLHITWDETATGCGPTGKAIRQGVPVTCNNVQTDPEYGPWRERAQREGFAATLALPLRLGGEVVGALNIYATTPEAFSEDIIELLSRATDDLAYGIANRRAEIEYERGRAEVQRLEQRNTLILNAIGEGIYGMDLDGRATFINPAALAMLQGTEQELLGQIVHDCHHHTKADGAPYPKEECILSGACRDGVISSGEDLFWRKDGTSFPIEYINTPIRDEQGELIGAVVSFNDITRRKQAEMDLRAALVKAHEGESRLQAIMAAMGEGLSIQDTDYIITYQNEVVKNLMGDHVGEHCYMAYENNDQVCEGCPVAMVYRDGGIHKAERSETIGQNTIYREVTASPLKDLKGNIVAAIEVIRDVTEQKNLEAQLLHAQKMEAVGTLAGGVAHDFNNILNVILGYGTMVMDTLAADSKAKKDMHEVLLAADRAVDLTKRLLIFSRKQVVDVQSVNINELIHGLQKMLVRIIRENIDFHLDLADRPLIVQADAGQIEQVLINLAVNARDAMPENGRLTISTGLEEVNEEYVAAYGYGKLGRYALITVADTGQGMDAETQKKIFEPFFTTKGIGEGTGLGLAISYGIIKQHNGYIQVSSEPGHGTVFKIYLPLSETVALPDTKTEDVVAVKGGNETILVAEDDATLRKLTEIILESFGYTVITAEDGEEAITKFMENRERIRLVVLDMIMPKKNGKEVSAAIRKVSPRMGILFVSGYTMDIITNKELTEGGFDFIQKPFSLKIFLAKVREVLDR